MYGNKENCIQHLGVVSKKRVLSEINIDTFFEEGNFQLYRCTSTELAGTTFFGQLISSRSPAMKQGGLIYVRITQVVTTQTGDIYSRTVTVNENDVRYPDSGMSSTWQRIDNYGTTTLSGLASALGAFGSTTCATTIITSGDILDYTTPGKYRVKGANSANVTGEPTEVGNQAFKWFALDLGGTKIILLFAQAGVFIKYEWEQWSSWDQIADGVM